VDDDHEVRIVPILEGDETKQRASTVDAEEGRLPAGFVADVLELPIASRMRVLVTACTRA